MNLSGRTINNRYRLHEKAREDSLGESYHAEDLTDGTRPLMFTVFNRESVSRRTEDIIRFKSDVKKLIGHRHENCAAAYETGTLLDYCYLVSEPVEGPSLAALMETRGRLPYPETLDIALGAARGLAFLHERGIVLQNLGPESIVVTGSGVKIVQAGTAHIRDFGRAAGADGILGLVEYLSPEQSGMAGRPADGRSDLFSLGAILYRLATGLSPFRGSDVCSTLYRVITGEPDFGAITAPGAPGAFADVIRKLIEKEPDGRYQGAPGLLADLEALKRGETGFVPGSSDRGNAPSFYTGIVGRERELADMKARYDAAFEGRGSLCLIGGEAGAGKTRLVEELEGHVFSRGGFVLYSKCNEAYDASPYGAVMELLGSFMKTSQSLSADERRAMKETLSRKFSGRGGILVKLNPALEEIFGDAGAPSALDERSESARFHAVTAQFFLCIGAIRPGLVIVIDDIQWSDEGSLSVLGEVLAGLADSPVMVILAARSEAAAGRDRLRGFMEKSAELGAPCLEIEAGPFDREKTALLVGKMLRAGERDAANIAPYIHERSRGNVFFSISLLRKMAGDHIIRLTDNGWALDRERAEALDAPDSLLGIVLSRVGLLDQEEARVLSCAAAIGREFSLSALFALTSLDSDAVVSVIDRAVDYQILRPYPGERNTYMFFHDRIKEILYENIPPEELKGFHLAIARAIESSCAPGGTPHYELARHFLLAGADDEFLTQALPAARSAREKFAYEDAEKILSRAIELIKSPDDPRWAGAREELGRIYLITGNFAGSVAACEEILPLVREPEARAALLALKSEAHYRLNEWDECVRAAHAGLLLLGEKFPRGSLSLILRGIKEFGLFSANLVRRGKAQARGAPRTSDLEIIALYRALIQNYMFRNQGLEFVYSSFRMAVISQSRIGPSKELSISLIGVGLIFTALAFFKTALKLLDRALRMSLDAGDRWCEAYAHGFKALVSEFMGRYREGIDLHYGRSMRTFTETGDIKNIGVIHIGLVQSYCFLSEYETALEHNRESYAIARKIDDRYFTGMALVYFARIHRERGDLEEAERYALMARDYNRDNSLTQNLCAALTELGCLRLDQGNPGEAIGHLETARLMHEKGYFSKQHTIHVYAHLAEAYLADLSLRGRSMTGKERRGYRRKIRRSAAAAVRHGRRWVSHLGKALRARAAGRVSAGARSPAEKDFLRSIAHCRSLGNRYDLARSYYELGLFLMQERRAAESRETIESAYTIFREIGAAAGAATCGRILGIGADGDSGSIGRIIHRERETALREISKSLAGGNPGQDLRHAVERIFEYFGAREGCLFARNPGNGELNLVFSMPAGNPDRMNAYRPCAETSLLKEHISQRESGDINETGSSPVHQGDDGVVCITMGAGDDAFGVCCLREPHFIGAISEADMAIIRDILAHSLMLMSRPAAFSPDKAPRGDDITALTDSAVSKLEKAIEYIGDNYRSEISRDGLAAHLGMSPNYFSKLFRDYTGQKMNDYITGLRVREAMRLLGETGDRIIDIAYSVGFDNLRTFNRAFQNKLRMTPQQYRESVKKQP
jgi:AraC-like DNA-binding protein